MTDSTLEIPTIKTKLIGAGRTALFTGQLTLDGTCVHLSSEAGQLAIIWPHGYAARTHPLRILDADGHVVAREGDQIRFNA